MPEPGERKLTQKMRAWTLLTFKTNEPTESYMEIYQCKKERVAAACASRLLTKANVQALMVELRQKAVDDSIMTVKERKQRLSEFGREDIRNDKGTLTRHGSIAAMDLLNKMDKIYSDGTTVNVDNRRVEITVVYGKDKKPPSEIINGDSNEA